MAEQGEYTISNIHGSVVKDSPDVYLTFRLGDEHSETSVVKPSGETVQWEDPVIIKAHHGDETETAADSLEVRAYHKRSMLPDSLLGQATVQLSSQGDLGNSQVAGSGGGAAVQVQLLGKKDQFGGALQFTVSATEGMTVPGGSTWGPQEVYHGDDKQSAVTEKHSLETAPASIGPGLAAAATSTATLGAVATSAEGTAPLQPSSPGATAGYTGDGATAFPASAGGAKLPGEHLSDFEKGGPGEAPLHATRDGSWINPRDFEEQGASSGTAVDAITGFSGGGASAFPARNAGSPLHGEHLSDFEKGRAGSGTEVYGTRNGSWVEPQAQQGGDSSKAAAPTAGISGAGGATAFPAEASGTHLGGEHLSDFDKGGERTAASDAAAATAGVGGAGGATAFPAEASGEELGGEHLSDFKQSGVEAGQGRAQGVTTASTAPIGGEGSGLSTEEAQEARAVTTAGHASQGATAYPGQEAGENLGGKHLSDFGQKHKATSTAGEPGVMAAQGDVDDELRISGIGAKLMREEDLLGHVTPYLVFEVGRESLHTKTLKKGVKSLQPLTWEEDMTLEVDDPSAQLRVIAYDKKMLLLPDSRLGEVSASLSQLPRGRPVRLTLQDKRALGNRAGEVTFTLTGGGPGGEGAGNDQAIEEDAAGLSMPR